MRAGASHPFTRLLRNALSCLIRSTSSCAQRAFLVLLLGFRRTQLCLHRTVLVSIRRETNTIAQPGMNFQVSLSVVGRFVRRHVRQLAAASPDTGRPRSPPSSPTRLPDQPLGRRQPASPRCLCLHIPARQVFPNGFADQVVFTELISTDANFVSQSRWCR